MLLSDALAERITSAKSLKLNKKMTIFATSPAGGGARYWAAAVHCLNTAGGTKTTPGVPFEIEIHKGGGILISDL